MSTNAVTTDRRHAYPGLQTPVLEEPSHAERARTLVSMRSSATLSTLSRRQLGFPFGSLMPYGLDALGRPLFLISSMAMHTQNLKTDSRASLFIEQAAVDGDPLGAARVTLLGHALPLTPEEAGEVREYYLSRHQNSSYWVDFADFSFFRLQIVDLYYVGGFGVMGWVSASDYERARPDPLAESAAGILAHMNADHVSSMLLLARVHAQITGTSVTMTSIDRLGFCVRLKTKEGFKVARINFLKEVSTGEETRQVLIEMVRQAKIKAWM